MQDGSAGTLKVRRVCVHVCGDMRLRRNVWSLSLGDKWAVVTPLTSPDVPGPHAARVVDRPERRRVTA